MPDKKFDQKTIKKIAIIAIKNLILEMEQTGKYSPARFQKIADIARQYGERI